MRGVAPTPWRYAAELLRGAVRYGEDTNGHIAYVANLVVVFGPLAAWVAQTVLHVQHWPGWLPAAVSGAGLLIGLGRSGYRMWADAQQQLQRLQEPGSPAPSLKGAVELQMGEERYPSAEGVANAPLGDKTVLLVRVTDTSQRGVSGLEMFVTRLEKAHRHGWEPVLFNGAPNVLSEDLPPGATREGRLVWAQTAKSGARGQLLPDQTALDQGCYRITLALEASSYTAFTVEYSFALHSITRASVLAWLPPGGVLVTLDQTCA